MQAMTAKLIRVFTKTLPEEMRQEFENERAVHTLRNCKYLSVLVMVFELFNMYMMACVRDGGLSVHSHRVYFVLYILLFTISLAGFVLSLIFERDVDRFAGLSLKLAVAESGLFCLWGTAVTLYDQRVTENVSVYLCIVLSVSIFVSYRPWEAVIVLGINQIILMLLFPTFQPVPTNNMGNYTNTACATIMAVLIAAMRYNNGLETFHSRKIIVSQKEKIEEMNRKLHIQVLTDELTRLYNRRYLKEVMPQVWKQYQEDSRQVTFVMMDIDNFKIYNDTYGHQAGDDCIALIAGLLKSHLNLPDCHLLRYGGEEFLAIIAGKDGEEIADKVNKARLDLEQRKLENRQAPLPYVTISAGMVTQTLDQTMRLEHCIRQADVLLYQAKQKGKNQMIIGQDTP